MLDSRQTVAELILEHSECAAVFARHHIDFCCRGGLSIEEACKKAELETAALMAELSRAIDERKGERQSDPRALATPVLIEHIVATHHEYLRKALPFIRALASKVATVHGRHNPRLRELRTVVEQLSEALEPHLDEEEQKLFPLLQAQSLDAEKARAELSAMHQEHLAVGALLERVRNETEDFVLPEWACNSYRTLFSELEDLEADVHKHIHLENHVLMPRFASAQPGSS